jgi:hypothetical protein
LELTSNDVLLAASISRQCLEILNTLSPKPFSSPRSRPEAVKMDKRVKEVAKEDAERIKNLATEAFKSQAYLYPLKVLIDISR